MAEPTPMAVREQAHGWGWVPQVQVHVPLPRPPHVTATHVFVRTGMVRCEHICWWQAALREVGNTGIA